MHHELGQEEINIKFWEDFRGVDTRNTQRIIWEVVNQMWIKMDTAIQDTTKMVLRELKGKVWNQKELLLWNKGVQEKSEQRKLVTRLYMSALMRTLIVVQEDR